MSSTSFPLLRKALRPIDPLIVRVLRRVDRVARNAGIPYFIAGATARDLILVNVYGMWAGRSTRDIDFGVAVESWEQFSSLRDGLTAGGEFEAYPHALHRLAWRDEQMEFPMFVDLIPFGGVTSADGHILWPPKNDVAMNVAGFEEALASSILLAVEDKLGVRVASVPGLTMLKLAAWADRGNTTTKDAIDLFQLVSTYAHAGNLDRLYDEAISILEAAEFDVQMAGAQLLGRDVSLICPASMEDIVRRLVRDDATFERLSDQAVNSKLDSDANLARKLLQLFRRGLASGTLIYP